MHLLTQSGRNSSDWRAAGRAFRRVRTGGAAIGKTPLRAMAAKSWINEMLTGCGGENIFNASIGDYPQVSIENILSEKPDVIIIPSHHGNGLGEGDFWQKWPEYQHRRCLSQSCRGLLMRLETDSVV